MMDRLPRALPWAEDSQPSGLKTVGTSSVREGKSAEARGLSAVEDRPPGCPGFAFCRTQSVRRGLRTGMSEVGIRSQVAEYTGVPFGAVRSPAWQAYCTLTGIARRTGWGRLMNPQASRPYSMMAGDTGELRADGCLTLVNPVSCPGAA
jgi:hypothetical protein